MKAATISETPVSPRQKLSGAGKRVPEKFRISKILVPVDFSGPSQQAIGYALSLGKHFRAELHLVHVFEPPSNLVNVASLPLVLPNAEIKSELQVQLQKIAETHGIKDPQKAIHTLQGRPYEEICRFATKSRTDLIVIPTRGSTGLKHLILGSTAERVVRYSPCPVLVLRPGRDQSAVNFRKIVVPIDFSPCSMEALGYARNLAAEFGSSLVLLHSVHLQYYVASDEYARYDFPEVMKEAEEAARDQMRELVEKTDWKGVQVETALESGHPGQQICDRSKDRGADLIVTSTHGNTGLKHVLLGSTAEYVVRHATSPVLVVPTRERISFN